MTRFALCLTILTALSACQEETAMPTPTEQDPIPVAARCAKDKVTPLIGKDKSALDTISLPDPVRILPPNAAMTRDYRLDRTNIDLDEDGRIVRAWCG